MEHTTFNGDRYIREEIQKLVVRFNVQAIIETGTWSAHSTREFAKLAPQVFTIDATPRRLVTGTADAFKSAQTKEEHTRPQQNALRPAPPMNSPNGAETQTLKQ